MCEIHIISKNANLNNKDIQEFFKLMVYGSLYNKDGFGFFNDKIRFKKSEKFTLKEFKDNAKLKSKFLIGHNRFATSKNTSFNINAHPFKVKCFECVHNGVIHNHNELKEKYLKDYSNITTDSFIIPYLINFYFEELQKPLNNSSEKNNAKTRFEFLVMAIQKALSEIEGSLSVVLYDTIGKYLFYFKNDRTTFHFININKNVLIGSTALINLEYVYNEGFKEKENRKELDIKDNHIYLIDGIDLKDCGEFENKKDIVIVNNREWASDYNKNNGFYFDDGLCYEDIGDSVDCDLKCEIEYILSDILGENIKTRFENNYYAMIQNKDNYQNVLIMCGINFQCSKKWLRIVIDDIIDYAERNKFYNKTNIELEKDI